MILPHEWFDLQIQKKSFGNASSAQILKARSCGQEKCNLCVAGWLGDLARRSSVTVRWLAALIPFLYESGSQKLVDSKDVSTVSKEEIGIMQRTLNKCRTGSVV
jgi:hypothetical protein